VSDEKEPVLKLSQKQIADWEEELLLVLVDWLRDRGGVDAALLQVDEETAGALSEAAGALQKLEIFMVIKAGVLEGKIPHE
jgi:hypothetical protein